MFHGPEKEIVQNHGFLLGSLFPESVSVFTRTLPVHGFPDCRAYCLVLLCKWTHLKLSPLQEVLKLLNMAPAIRANPTIPMSARDF